EAVALLARRHGTVRRTAHRDDQRAEGFLHVLRLIVFVFAELPVEAQHGNAETVNGRGIELAVRVLVRNHLAASVEADRRAVILAIVGLELLAVAAAVHSLNAAAEPGARLTGAAPH